MELKHFLTDKRAVSPVIGVILMVAITVILAAVIGTFVLGLGGNVTATPTAQFTFDQSGNEITISHDGGDAIEAGNLVFKGDIDHDGSTWDQVVSGVDADNQVTAGDTATVTSEGSGTLRIVYTSPSSDNTATIAKYEMQ